MAQFCRYNVIVQVVIPGWKLHINQSWLASLRLKDICSKLHMLKRKWKTIVCGAYRTSNVPVSVMPITTLHDLNYIVIYFTFNWICNSGLYWLWGMWELSPMVGILTAPTPKYHTAWCISMIKADDHFVTCGCWWLQVESLVLMQGFQLADYIHAINLLTSGLFTVNDMWTN